MWLPQHELIKRFAPHLVTSHIRFQVSLCAMVLGEAPRRRVYTPEEVAQHSSPDDCWVSFNGKVVDVTDVVQGNGGPLSIPLLEAAGTDISHWFGANGELKSYVDPETNLRVPYTPMGRFVNVPPRDPRTDYSAQAIPWWKDSTLVLGRLTARMRRIRVKNVLTEQEMTLSVPQEETITEIQERVLDYNWHATSYTWKALLRRQNGSLEFTDLDMGLTLQQNGVIDEAYEYEKLGLEKDFHTPVLHLYFNDDLTVA